MADSSSSTPVPVPRPRHRPNNAATVTEDSKISNISSTTSQDEPDCIGTASEQIPSLYPKLNQDSFPSLYRKQDYENFEIIHPRSKAPKVQNNKPEAEPSSRPVPAPRRTKVVVHEDPDSSSHYQNFTPAAATAVTTGAIKKPQTAQAPSSPGITTVRNDLRGTGATATSSPGMTSSKRFSFDSDSLPEVISRSESDGVSIGSGDSSGRKYKTNSPGELFKSIGITSKLLKESITERMTHKSKKVASKLDKNFKNWGTEASSKLKNVSKSINSLAEDKLSMSLTRSKDGKAGRSNSTTDEPDFLERRQTVPVENSDLMKNIQFNSPLNNKINNRDDLTKGSSSSSTYDIPKSAKRTNFEEPPMYEDVMTKSKSNSSMSLASGSSSSTNLPPARVFTRNSGLSQSLYSKVVPKKDRNEGFPSPGPLRQKNKSESNLQESKFYIDSVREIDIGSSSENIPPPKFPAPVLHAEEVPGKRENPYGKLNIIPQSTSGSSSDEDNTLPEMLKRIKIRKKSENYENVAVGSSSGPDSRRATCNSVQRVFSRRTSSIDELRNNLNLRSDSWNFYDISNRDGQQPDDEDEDSSRLSTPEPTYANESPLYGQICEMETSLLKPEPLNARPIRHDYDDVSISDIIDEFDPLAHRRSLAAMLEKTGGNAELTLIENILSAETYGRQVKLESSDESLVPEDTPKQLPKPPKRSDSLMECSVKDDIGPPNKDPPPIPHRKKSRSPKRSMIIHQNLNLPSDSIENLVDETEIEPYLARVEEPGSSREPADLSYPSSSQGPQTSWFVADDASGPEPDKFHKSTKVNPLNEKADGKPVEKIQKELPTELSRINEDDTYLPSYMEAIGAEVHGEPLPGPSSSRPSVTSKLFNALKRKSSFKAKADTRMVLEMIPKPLLTERFISHQGHVLKLPSGMIGDVFNELAPRSAVFCGS